MFTGLVERRVPIAAWEEVPGGRRLVLDLGPLAEGLATGASVSCAGACLTVIRLEGSLASFDLSQETLDRTRFGGLQAGALVNVERSLRVGDRMGGHFVTGHVDGIGEVLGIREERDFAVHRYRAPRAFLPWLVPKGSVTVDGVSLTVAKLEEGGVFEVALIPETLRLTTLGLLREGDRVHLEGDLIGKYVQRFLEVREELSEQSPFPG